MLLCEKPLLSNILRLSKIMKSGSHLLRPFRQLGFIAVLCLSFLSLPLCAQEHYLPAGQPDAMALLPPPPLPGSPEQAADMQEVRTVSRSAPSDDVAVAFTEKEFTIFNFTPAIGAFFQPGKFPKTEAFMHGVQHDAETVTDNAKLLWKRPRPFMIDPTLATGKLEKSFSYPSGHSTESMVLALVLADLFPDKRDAILAEARTIGWHRVEIARHYPTDIYAGRVLAQAIVRQMKENPDYQHDFAAAQAEIAAAQVAAKSN
jgi:acid phosphatase (class A)